MFPGASLQQAADATDYTRDAVAPVVRDLRAGRPTSYPGTVRQLVITGLGRDQSTVIIIITNDTQITTKALTRATPAG